MQTFSNQYYAIEYPDSTFHSDNKCVIRVKRMSSNVAYVNIPNFGATYRVFDNNFITIDISDYARANSPGGITIDIVALDSAMQELWTFTFGSVVVKGFYSNAITWPLKKYIVCGEDDVQPIQAQTPFDLQLQMNNAGTWIPLSTFFANAWVDIELPIGHYRLVSELGLTDNYEFTIEDYKDDCKYANSIPIVWLSENGFTKKWIFEITNQIRRTGNSQQIETYTDGYDIRKDKQVQLQVTEKQADINVRLYLADLVYSSDIYTSYVHLKTSEEMQVPITVSDSSTNIDITTSYSDFTLTLNVAEHDNL